MNVGNTVFSIFLLLFLGYGMKKARVLSRDDANLLNTVVLYVTLPAFVFETIHNYHQPIPWTIARIPVIGFAMIAVTLVIAYVIGRLLRLDRPTLGAMVIAAGFGNTGFLGYPVTLAAFNDQGALVTAVLYDMLAMALPLYIVGSIIAARHSGERAEFGQIARMLLLPPMLVLPLALILRPVTVPSPIMNAIHYLSQGTVPLVMISLGLSLSASSLRGYTAPVIAVCVLKLAVLPLISYYAYGLGGVTGITHQAGVLEAAMPTAAMACVVATKFGANGRFVAGVIFITTLLSLVTIPAVLVILGVR